VLELQYLQDHTGQLPTAQLQNGNGLGFDNEWHEEDSGVYRSTKNRCCVFPTAVLSDCCALRPLFFCPKWAKDYYPESFSVQASNADGPW